VTEEHIIRIPGGLYGQFFGMNQYAIAILEALGLKPDDFFRFRDACVAQGEIAVYTRLGGGNRRDYTAVFEAMRHHPNYMRDEDDTFDSTYCTFYFSLPDQYRNILSKFDIGEKWDPSRRWKEKVDAVKSGNEPIPITLTDLFKGLKEKLK
jgi:hypothetical protein